MSEWVIKLKIENTGYCCWLKGTLFHNNNGPALIMAGWVFEWYVNGQLHRLDGPAIEWAYGSKEYYVNNQKFTSVFEYWLSVSLEATQL